MNFYEIYNTYWYKYADQRLLRYPLFGSPLPIICVLVVYWTIIKIGSQCMALRPACEIKSIIQIYNVLQILVCGWMGGRVLYLIFQKDLRCLAHNTESEYDLTMVFYAWLYSILKLADLMDTVFFVLRKKFNLITTLHVYHHLMMLLSTYLIGRYYVAGELSFMSAVNSLVHSVMYSYYFYCLHRDSKGTIWWKRHVTQLQIVQFVFLGSVYTWKLLVVHDCAFPKNLTIFCLSQCLILLVMFINYYYHAFVKVQKSQVDENEKNGEEKKK